MSLTLSWGDIALRIALTTLAGAAIGFERGERGHAAGLRTTILVALAACLAMIQANLLMPTAGKAPDSFVVLDLMRLPLGILSGVGFIGAGAIFKRDNLILGVTTAATLWFVTVIGLCFGGGQIGLGVAGSVLGLVIISGLKLIERQMKQHRNVEFAVRWRGDDFSQDEALRLMAEAELEVTHMTVKYGADGEASEIRCALRERCRPDRHDVPRPLAELARRTNVVDLEWKT
jgi:putative Mg2+ transporter-C (MgtC) family protein